MRNLRFRRGVLAMAILAGLFVIPIGAEAAGRPTGPLAPASGAWFGGSVNQLNDGVNGGQARSPRARRSSAGVTTSSIGSMGTTPQSPPRSRAGTCRWDASR